MPTSSAPPANGRPVENGRTFSFLRPVRTPASLAVAEIGGSAANDRPALSEDHGGGNAGRAQPPA